MRTTSLVAGLLIVSVLGRTATTAQQAPTTITIESLAHRVMQAEAALTARLRAFKPMVEVYVQHVEPHERLGSVPIRDEYFLGQFEYSDLEGPTITPLTPEKRARQQMSELLARPFGMRLRPSGFLAMTVPDWRLMDGRRYELKFLRREFLGDVRCLVLDVAPRGDSRDGFTGRIWVEDREFNIVRFNGITRSLSGSTLWSKTFWFSVDSWRVNVKPGFWLPSYVYSEQQSDEGPTIKSQTRLWGYSVKSFRQPKGLTTVPMNDRQAEDNVLERLSRAGLLAPPGEVDKVLETVATNLLITNNLTIEPVKARVLLTSPLESFTAGRTIVLSRGLIDVLPDEASLATMLAHELAHIVLGHRAMNATFAFGDPLMMFDDELLSAAASRHTLKEEEAANARAIELLRNSPYKDKLADVGLFLRAVADNAHKLKKLIQPHVTQLILPSPSISPERLDQVAALPLGARVIVDPWIGRVELLKAQNVPLASPREKASLAVTPLMPYLRYAEARP